MREASLHDEDDPCPGAYAFDCDGTETGHLVQIQRCDMHDVFKDDEAATLGLIAAAEKGERWAINEVRDFLAMLDSAYPEVPRA